MDEDIEDVTERLPIVNELILHYQKCHYIHGSDPHNHGVEYTYSSGYKKVSVLFAFQCINGK